MPCTVAVVVPMRSVTQFGVNLRPLRAGQKIERKQRILGPVQGDPFKQSQGFGVAGDSSAVVIPIEIQHIVCLRVRQCLP